jgi:hypothetical protein
MSTFDTSEDMVNHMVHSAITLFNHAGGELQPMWVLYAENGEVIPVVTRWENDNDKVAAVEFIKKLIKERNVIRFGFMSEVWVAYEDKDEPSGIMPSERPDRKEAIMVIVEDHDGFAEFGSMEITRDSDGSPVLGQYEKKAGPGVDGVITGRFFNLFEKKRVLN